MLYLTNMILERPSCQTDTCHTSQTSRLSGHPVRRLALWDMEGLLSVMMITPKGANRDFLQSPHCAANYNNNNNCIQRRYSRFLQSPHSATNCLQHACSSGPGAIVCKSHTTHRALITCKCRVTCHLMRRDSSAIKFDRVEIAFT